MAITGADKRLVADLAARLDRLEKRRARDLTVLADKATEFSAELASRIDRVEADGKAGLATVKSAVAANAAEIETIKTKLPKNGQALAQTK